MKRIGWWFVDLLCAAIHLVLGDEVERPKNGRIHHVPKDARNRQAPH